MWAFIFGALALGSILGILYLISRFAKFQIIQKMARGKKLLAFLLGIVPVLLLVFAIRAGLGSINAAISILHLMAVWLVSDLISKI